MPPGPDRVRSLTSGRVSIATELRVSTWRPRNEVTGAGRLRIEGGDTLGMVDHWSDGEGSKQAGSSSRATVLRFAAQYERVRDSNASDSSFPRSQIFECLSSGWNSSAFKITS